VFFVEEDAQKLLINLNDSSISCKKRSAPCYFKK